MACLAPREGRADCEPSGTIPPALIGQSGCQLASLGITPLDDLGCGTYEGFEGGLYPGGDWEPPATHKAAGWTAAGSVVPRRSDGSADAANGKIGFVSIGMSNASMEFDNFVTLSRSTPGINPHLVMVDGAQSTRVADQWAAPASSAWTVLRQRVLAAGLAQLQVQAIWIKQAEGDPASFGEFPAHAEILQQDLTRIVLIAKAQFPNLRVVYFASRTRAYTAIPGSLNPEPYAYESAFAVKWLIEDQIAGDPTLRFTGANPPAPWLAWGPYLWADGENPRSDGFLWNCSDVIEDFVHPSFAGQDKIAAELMSFFLNDPIAARWFAAPRNSGCGLLGIEPVLVLASVGIARRMRHRKRV